MVLKESRGHVIDKETALSGEKVLISANESEAVILSYDRGDLVWYIGSHLSVLAAEGDEIVGARWYHNRIGYVEQMHEGIAILTEEAPPEVWSEIYASIEQRADNSCSQFCYTIANEQESHSTIAPTVDR